MRKSLILLAVLCFCTACIDKSKYMPDPDKTPEDNVFYENLNFSFAFSTRRTITIKKTNNSFMAIYYAYPYTVSQSGEQVLRDADAVLYAAETYTLDIPKDVTEIYYWNGRKFVDTSIKGITTLTLPENSRGFASGDLSADDSELLDLISNDFFPEAKHSRTKADLQTCCDLVIKSDPTQGELKQVTLTLSYIGDGGCNLMGNLFLYTYPTQKRDNLTLDDITLYTFDGGPQEVSNATPKYTDYSSHLTTFKISDPSVLNTTDYRKKGIISQNKVNGNLNNNVKFRQDIVITHPDFKEGNSIGFCYMGHSDATAGFSTPELNPRITKKDVQTSIGKVDFNNELHTRCLVYHFTHNGNTYNILGCENRYVGHSSYDGDYNDMLVMIQTDPSYIKPAGTIGEPSTDSYINYSGYWLFEDLYPEFQNNDLDYNDVVVKYTCRQNTTKNTTELTCDLMASGCAQSNTFGVNGETIFTGINGYRNVDAQSSGNVAPLNTKSIVLNTTELDPWIAPNGNGVKLTKGLYSQQMQYPYVLDVPSTFPGWCIEQIKIMTVYNDFPTKSTDNANNIWYTKLRAPNNIVRIQ